MEETTATIATTHQPLRALLLAILLVAASPSLVAAIEAPTAKALADGSYLCTAAHAALLVGSSS